MPKIKIIYIYIQVYEFIYYYARLNEGEYHSYYFFFQVNCPIISQNGEKYVLNAHKYTLTFI